MTLQEIQAVISELNRLSVSGESNLDILLGCISFLKSKLHQDAKGGDESG